MTSFGIHSDFAGPDGALYDLPTGRRRRGHAPLSRTVWPNLDLALDETHGRTDLDDALIDKIATQSDEQAGDRSIRELERIRDENLSAIACPIQRRRG